MVWDEYFVHFMLPWFYSITHPKHLGFWYYQCWTKWMGSFHIQVFPQRCTLTVVLFRLSFLCAPCKLPFLLHIRYTFHIARYRCYLSTPYWGFRLTLHKVSTMHYFILISCQPSILTTLIVCRPVLLLILIILVKPYVFFKLMWASSRSLHSAFWC